LLLSIKSILLNCVISKYFGYVTGGSTPAANILGLLCARQFIGKSFNINIADEGISKIGIIKVYGAEVHESVKKAISIVGIGRDNFCKISSIGDKIDVNDLEKKIKKDKNSQKIIIVTLEKVNSGEFDDIYKILKICKKYNIWLHIDAAFGLFAHLSEKHKKYTKYINQADSITTDLHKWLNVPYDCGVFL